MLVLNCSQKESLGKTENEWNNYFKDIGVVNLDLKNHVILI
tara:strand:+ start:400 stop:522 length:123 start_codon:yes stop_codon:yes gene_type:complete